MFLPNGSLFYNTETKRLHKGIVDETGALDHAGAELGTFTFNSVVKSNPWGSWVIWLIPGKARTYPAQMFSTMETVGRILTIVRAKFPELKWNYIGNPIAPEESRDQVNIVATDKDGRSEMFSPGELALNIMYHDEPSAMANFGLEVKDTFGLGFGS